MSIESWAERVGYEPFEFGRVSFKTYGDLIALSKKFDKTGKSVRIDVSDFGGPTSRKIGDRLRKEFSKNSFKLDGVNGMDGGPGEGIMVFAENLEDLIPVENLLIDLGLERHIHELKPELRHKGYGLQIFISHTPLLFKR